MPIDYLSPSQSLFLSPNSSSLSSTLPQEQFSIRRLLRDASLDIARNGVGNFHVPPKASVGKLRDFVLTGRELSSLAARLGKFSAETMSVSEASPRYME